MDIVKTSDSSRTGYEAGIVPNRSTTGSGCFTTVGSPVSRSSSSRCNVALCAALR
ncbi:unnamed protein product, partial [Nesidiocoris tenuis]